SGTNRKWYIAVAANCSRDRSTTLSIGMYFSLIAGSIERGMKLIIHPLWRDINGERFHKTRPKDIEEDQFDNDDSNQLTQQFPISHSLPPSISS
ncbi:hypothetical protein, partial [Microvirgula sp. AG722]|uniref:hypothetical protein n=1 Tax=Microvirgula sp. AG722 TaxID=2183901 RepID=UPI001F3C9F98